MPEAAAGEASVTLPPVEESPVAEPTSPWTAATVPTETAPLPDEPAVAQPTAPETVTEETATAEPVAPQSPYQQPPMNGWSSDGGYRYVPPSSAQPPVTPPYQSPTPPYGSYSPNGYTPYRPATPVQPTTPPYGTASPVPPMGNNQPPRKKGNGWVVALALVAAIAIIGCVVLGAYIGISRFDRPGIDSNASTDSSADGDTSRPDVLENAPSLDITSWDNDDGGLATKEIVKRNYASTVLLTAYSQTEDYYYFGQSDLVEAGAATGIVMTADGYIITNRHCVVNESTGEPFDQIDVTLYGGKVYENARVVGADESTDLAVIHVEANDLTPAQFGDSAELEVGDRVVALGNAAGLEWSASEGIVSALARDVYDDTGYAIRCLQVDASINPGNSGGPLLNNQGLVVGINSAKISATDYEGIGFTIPINEAKTIVDSLIKYGYVKGRVALGITGQTVSSGQYNGFMITEIQSGSDLKNTEAKVGDLIVSVDGVTVVDYGTLRAELAKHKVGDTVTLELLRSDRRTGRVTSHKVKVKLQEQTN